MNDYAAAAGNISDYVVARRRIAAPCDLYHHIAFASDFENDPRFVQHLCYYRAVDRLFDGRLRRLERFPLCDNAPVDDQVLVVMV